MINLLPYDYRSELRAARTNVLLTKYIGTLGGAILVLGGLVYGAHITLDASRASAQEAMDASIVRADRYSQTRALAESLRTDLATAKLMLDQKISYTKLIYEISDALPAGVVLSTLTLDPASFGSEMTLNASAKDFKSASQLETRLASKSDLFSSVKLLSMESGEGTTGENTEQSPDAVATAEYPIQVSVSVLINKEAL